MRRRKVYSVNRNRSEEQVRTAVHWCCLLLPVLYLHQYTNTNTGGATCFPFLPLKHCNAGCACCRRRCMLLCQSQQSVPYVTYHSHHSSLPLSPASSCHPVSHLPSSAMAAAAARVTKAATCLVTHPAQRWPLPLPPLLHAAVPVRAIPVATQHPLGTPPVCMGMDSRASLSHQHREHLMDYGSAEAPVQ